MIVAVGLRACIDRLLAGDVRTTDLHKLFFDMREEVGGKGIVSEIGDFIAHPRIRTRGIIVQEVRNAVAGLRLRAIVKNQEKIVTTDIPASLPELLRANLRRMRPSWLKAIGIKPAEARDAMPDGGLIKLLAQNTAATESATDLPHGDYLRISVLDTGCGMSPETMAHAFEPLFTTKSLGKGTGLGLSMVSGFAKQSGGAARIESALGHGTGVHMYIPRSEQSHQQATDCRVTSSG